MANIREIAKLSGVSKATVSRILNHDKTFSVSDSTRKRVFRISSQLNYTLSNTSNKDSVEKLHVAIVNCLSPEQELRDPYFSMIKNGIDEQAEIWGMKIALEIRLPNTGHDWSELATCGAVIVIGTLMESVLDKIYQHNQNIIIINDPRHFEKYDIIRNDFGYQTQQVLDLMKAKGHKRIAFIGGKTNLIDESSVSQILLMDNREKAYLEWMKLNNFSEFTDPHITKGWTTEEALSVTQDILAEEKQPTAILTASDPQAIGVYRAVQKAGYQIPDDIAIVSFDDINMVSYLYPALTTVRPAAQEMGREAINLVRERVVDRRKVALQVTVNSILIKRESL